MPNEKLTYFVQSVWWSNIPQRCQMCDRINDRIFEYASPGRVHVIRSCWDCLEFFEENGSGTMHIYLRCEDEEIEHRMIVHEHSKGGCEVKKVFARDAGI